MAIDNESNDSSAASGQGGEAESKQRTMESLQAEMNRKTEKLMNENQKLAQRMEELMGMLTPKQSAAAAPQEDDLETLVYKDPKAYAAKVKAEAAREAQRAVSESLNQQQQSNAILAQLTNEYPELSDSNSELTQKAVEAYKAMSAAERSSPIAYKTAVRDAAADLGILPKNKRRQSSDDFTMSGQSSGEGRRGAPSKEQQAIDNKTAEFAKLLGLDPSDKKVAERLKQRNQRKNWSRWE